MGFPSRATFVLAEMPSKVRNNVAAANIKRKKNAAKLFLEYMLSPEGQKVFRDVNYLPANPAVPPKDPTLTPQGGHFGAVLISPEETAAKLEQWVRIYNELFK